MPPGPVNARSEPNLRPAAAKPAAGKARPSPGKPRRRARPAAGQASARPVPVPNASDAATTHAYRQDAARHLYSLNLGSIYKGRMPPLLYAVGVLQVELDYMGNVVQLNWMRAPNHAPEVVAEIERTVRKAAPYPAAVNLGQVTYTDTWLWDRSGNFQLDTLTEGQLSEVAPAKSGKPVIRVASSDCKKPANKATC